MKVIFNLVWSSASLFVIAHVSMLITSGGCEPKLILAGTIKYKLSANSTRWFPGVAALRSPALTTYDASPTPDLCVILALMDFSVDV